MMGWEIGNDLGLGGNKVREVIVTELDKKESGNERAS